MKESIHIKNLGPIKDISLDDIRPLTVFIGESGSGKSTLMKAIALFRWINKMQNIRSFLKHSNISKSPFRFRMDTYLKNCGFEKYISSNTKIIYETSFSTGHNYLLQLQGNKLIGTSASSSIIDQEELQFNKVSFISETRNIIPLWAERGAASAGAYLGFYFHEVFNDFDLASNVVKEIEFPYLHLKFIVRKTHFGKKYYVRGNDATEYEIDLKSSSSGTQNAVSVTTIAEYFANHFNFDSAINESVLKFLGQSGRLTEFKPIKNLGDISRKIFLHIEEPELSLYPDAQCQLIAKLISTCFLNGSNKVELMFATHSPYIINYLNLLVRAHDSKALIDDANLAYEDLAVFIIEDGVNRNLKSLNSRLVNTNNLSNSITDIYHRYSSLR